MVHVIKSIIRRLKLVSFIITTHLKTKQEKGVRELTFPKVKEDIHSDRQLGRKVCRVYEAPRGIVMSERKRPMLFGAIDGPEGDLNR